MTIATAIILAILFFTVLVALALIWSFLRNKQLQCIITINNRRGQDEQTGTPNEGRRPETENTTSAGTNQQTGTPNSLTTGSPMRTPKTSTASPLSIVPASPIFCTKCGRAFVPPLGGPTECVICLRTPPSPAAAAAATK